MIPPGWTIKRADKPPFKRIELSIEHGRGMRYVAIVDSMARNPENILYFLADDLLKAQEDAPGVRATEELGKRTTSTEAASGREIPNADECAKQADASGPRGVSNAAANGGDARAVSGGCAQPIDGVKGGSDAERHAMRVLLTYLDGVETPAKEQGNG